MKFFFLFLFSASLLKVTAQNNSVDTFVVRSSEMKATINRDSTIAVFDSVLRVLPIENKYNIGVSIVSRSKINGKTPPDAIMHDSITEVYQIIVGRGILVTGGYLENPERIPTNSPIVQKIAGPSSKSLKIIGGTQKEVGPGDIIIIPPHTPHGFIKILTDRISYSLIRIDSQKLLELKY
jgi:hypothetical protein